jgi:hypothetical protein
MPVNGSKRVSARPQPHITTQPTPTQTNQTSTMYQEQIEPQRPEPLKLCQQRLAVSHDVLRQSLLILVVLGTFCCVIIEKGSMILFDFAS